MAACRWHTRGRRAQRGCANHPGLALMTPARAVAIDVRIHGEITVNLYGFLAIGLGGAVGCWLRWALSAVFNPVFPTLPLGTLAANLIGGLLMGVALGLWDHFHAMSPELKLFVFTGFLGGLTTFSTFSAESSGLLLREQYVWFAGHIAVHLIGSIGMTILGISLMRQLLRH